MIFCELYDNMNKAVLMDKVFDIYQEDTRVSEKERADMVELFTYKTDMLFDNLITIIDPSKVILVPYSDFRHDAAIKFSMEPFIDDIPPARFILNNAVKIFQEDALNMDFRTDRVADHILNAYPDMDIPQAVISSNSDSLFTGTKRTVDLLTKSLSVFGNPSALMSACFPDQYLSLDLDELYRRVAIIIAAAINLEDIEIEHYPALESLMALWDHLVLNAPIKNGGPEFDEILRSTIVNYLGFYREWRKWHKHCIF